MNQSFIRKCMLCSFIGACFIGSPLVATGEKGNIINIYEFLGNGGILPQDQVPYKAEYIYSDSDNVLPYKSNYY